MSNETGYAICVTQHWYGPRTTKRRLIDNDTGAEWQGSRADARALIAELDNAMYYEAHNEAGRAQYTVVRA